MKYYDNFDPDLFDPKGWAKAAARAGMKYFVLTTKHHEGFCLYDSHYTDFKITNTTSGTVSFTRNDGKKNWVLKVDSDDDDHHTAKIRWKVPYQWRGKTLKFRVKFVYYDKFDDHPV